METREKNIYEMLKEVHTALKYTEKVSLSAIAESFGENGTMFTVAKRGGLVTPLEGKSRGFYKWTGGDPSMAMARELLNRYNKYWKERNEARSTKKASKKEKKVNGSTNGVKVPQAYIGRFLGIPIKLTPVYK